MANISTGTLTEEKKQPWVNPDPDIDGFNVLSVKRGYTEIQPLYEFLQSYNAFICGGYVRFMISPRHQPVQAGDVDVYCYDESEYKNLKKGLKDQKLYEKAENNISITYKHPGDGPFKYCPTIQLIKPVIEARIVSVGNMKDILSNFDFSVVRCGLLSSSSALADNNFEEDEKRKLLRLKNIHCPISSTLRCLKYAKKGYWMKPMETLKLFIDWNERDDEYKFKLIEFLKSANGGTGLTKTDINEMEKMMRID